MADTDNLQTGTETPTSTPGDVALGALAKSEDATAYIQERQDQDTEDAGQEPETPKEQRQTHIEEALEKAREDTRRAREADSQLDREFQEAEQAWQQQQAQEQQAAQKQADMLAFYEARGRIQEQAEYLKQTNPALHKTIADNLTTLESVLEPDQQKALEYALVHYPDAVFNLGVKLSADLGDGQTIWDKIDAVRSATANQIYEAAAKGAAEIQQERYVQSRILRDRAERGRKVTSAPPPFKTPSGGANPPKDIHRLANKENATDYIRARMAQERRGEDR
jgi:hypothetical protein